MYETDNFITYWYGKGKNIGQAVVQLAELDHKEIQDVLEHRINDKIQIIVYSDISDLKQSNIGGTETFETANGQTKTIGSKMFVAFDGDHNNLRKKIRIGIANVYLNSMFSGSSLQEIVESTVSLNIPEWYSQGLISFMGSSWDYLKDDEMRDVWYQKNNRYRDFYNLIGDLPRLGGHSFWNFLDHTYGKNTIANLLYLSRIDRKLEDSFLFILGITFDDAIAQWYQYYDEKYRQEEGKFESDSLFTRLDLSNKMEVPISNLKLSPSGRSIVYAYNEQGKYKIVLRDLDSGMEKQLFKYGHKNALQETDYNYPLIAWNPNGREITVVYEHRDRIMLRKIDVDSKEYIEQILVEDFQRIYSISYISDFDYILSASTDGYSDLYKYRSKVKELIRITEDFYDDLDAEYVQLGEQKGILFASNRQDDIVTKLKMDTILPIGHFDLFFYPWEDDAINVIRLTHTPNQSERYPYLADDDKISYLNSSNGIRNRHVLSISDPSIQYTSSNKDRNIIRHHSVQGDDTYVYTVYKDGAYEVFVEQADWDKAISPLITSYGRQSMGIGLGDTPEASRPDVKEKIETIPIPSGQSFQSRFDDPEEVEDFNEIRTLEYNSLRFQREYRADTDAALPYTKVIKFNSVRAIASRSTFKLEDFTTKLDNSILFEGLESFAGDDKELLTAPIGILFQGKVKDLFEDYSIEGGIRIPTRFNGAEYYVLLDNNKRLIDKRYAIYRKTETNTEGDFLFPTQKSKRTSLLGQFRLSYPFDIYRSIRATTSLRFDKYFFLASDEFSSDIPVQNDKRLGLKVEYIFDNTLDVDVNIKHGTRYKFYGEALNKFNIQLTDGFEFDASKGFTAVVGFDARHYLPVLNHSIIALRAAGAKSMGSEKILYYAGGVENWIIPKFEENNPLPQGSDFAYKAVAGHLRGFKHNARNGTSFLLTNAEIRIPIFKYLSKRPLGSSFLRNIQLVGFFDMGTAWHGLTPNSDDNPINSVVIEQPPVLSIKVKYYRDPLIFGYGAGLRTMLFGYYLKVDYAWGIDSRTVLKPRLYFSLGTDF